MAVAENGAEPKKRGFALPSAYTILFALIVITAFLTYLIPAGTVRARRERPADPGHVPPGRVDPAADRRRLADGPDQRPVRHRERRGRQHQRLELRRAVRGDRRRAVHPRDRRVPRRDDEDRRDPGRHRAHRRPAQGPGALDDPDPHGRVRAGRHDLRDGRGEPRLLRADHHGHDRGGLRRAGRRLDRAPRLRDRRARLDDQPVRHRDRVGLRRDVDQRGPDRPTRDPGRRDGHRDRVRAPLRRSHQGRSEPVARVLDEGRERGAVPRDRGGRRGAHALPAARAGACSSWRSP